MTYNTFENVDKMYRSLRNRGFLWNVASAITVSSVGLISKLVVAVCNKCKLHNIDHFNEVLRSRKKGTPLITVSNHVSCFDDPGLWGTLTVRQLLTTNGMRWSLAADDVCFTNIFHSYFFLFGRSIPVIRGKGVYQTAIDFCLEELEKGQWVHVFPEGKVNLSKDFVRLKWGVGRLISESPTFPLVIPIWHIGMDSVLPNEVPYVFKFGKNLTVNFGKPIDLSRIMHNCASFSPEETKKAICDAIQIEMMKLKKQTEILHRKNFGI